MITCAPQSGDSQNNTVTESTLERLPTLKDVAHEEYEKDITKQERFRLPIAMDPLYSMERNYIIFNDFRYKEDLSKRITRKRDFSFYNYCLVSVCLSFILGFIIGVVIVGSSPTSVTFIPRRSIKLNNTKDIRSTGLHTLMLSKSHEINNINVIEKEKDTFATVSFTGAIESRKYREYVYPKTLTDDMRDILKDNKNMYPRHSISSILNKTEYTPNELTVLYNNVYWGPAVEDSMPQGYGENTAELWEKYVDQNEVIKMEVGCGRMQNRLITFRDGIQACVRYRQNTDQIQGEIFSFYVARLLNLTNLAPSVVKVIDLNDKLWQSVASDIAAAQWNTNRAVVLTQYIPSLEPATIPEILKPSTRHLNKNDVLKMTLKENNTVGTSKHILINKLKIKNVKSIDKYALDSFDHIDVKLNKKTIELFVELAQWSDLIIFDYLTANLDRIVNNLFNYQWNINIMDGPAHNLARKMDSGLLLFLDNESGLLHGYRLLKKYNVYHSLMLDNLCVFRKRTVDGLRTLYEQSVGNKLSDIFHKKNNAVIRDILPPLPEKNAKVLHERIGKILSQVDKCEQNYAKAS